MRATLPIVSALVVAACDKAATPAPVPARAPLDAATKAYAACVDAGARRLPVAGELPGSLADRAIANCTTERGTLLARTAEFYRAGHTNATAGYAKNVAEASVEGLDDQVRSAAVIAIVSRQNQEARH